CQALLRLADDRYCWFQRYHQRQVDLFSAALVTGRVAEVYTALGEGASAAELAAGALRPSPQPVPSTDNGHDRDREFWSQRMADWPEPVSLANGHQPQPGVLRRGRELSA